jgi:hypothetical protein
MKAIFPLSIVALIVSFTPVMAADWSMLGRDATRNAVSDERTPRVVNKLKRAFPPMKSDLP